VLSERSICLCFLNREKQTSKLHQNPTGEKKKPKPGYLEGLWCEIICISLLFHLAKQRKSLQSLFVCLPFQCALTHFSFSNINPSINLPQPPYSETIVSKEINAMFLYGTLTEAKGKSRLDSGDSFL